MNKCVVIVVLTLLSGYVHAQYGSRLGRFEVDEVKGCVPFTVTVTVVAPFVCDAGNPCDMDFEGNDNFQSLTFTHTYTQPGSYLLRILFQTTGLDDIPIEVTENMAPQFDVYTCGNNEVSVQLNDSNYDEYVINYNDASPEAIVNGTGTNHHVYTPGAQTISVRGRDFNADDNCAIENLDVTPMVTLPSPTITQLDVLDDARIHLEFDALPNIRYQLGIATNSGVNFQNVATIHNETAFTVPNLKTDDNYYCFQLAAFDPCYNTTTNSAVICSADLDVNVRNNAIDALWTTSPTGVSGYSLRREASDGTTLITSPAGSPYADLGIICGTEYCYQLTTQYANGSRSVSLIKCGVGFSDDIPTAIANITSVVTDNGVALEWQPDPNFPPAQFSVEKSTSGTYQLLATTAQPAFQGAAYTTEEASCYRIRYTDLCGNTSSPGIDACPLRLSATLLPDNSVKLTWTPYSGWTNGVAAYTIEKYSGDGVLLESIPAGTATEYIDGATDLDHQAFIYLIRATANDGGLTASRSNRVAILKDPNLFHPTAFTPNGDNLNDIFTVFGQYVVEFEMQIFNRWGELLFTTDDITSGWDGTFKGNAMPEGTYAFIANITDSAGRTFKRSGSVLLLRK